MSEDDERPADRLGLRDVEAWRCEGRVVVAATVAAPPRTWVRVRAGLDAGGEDASGQHRHGDRVWLRPPGGAGETAWVEASTAAESVRASVAVRPA